MPDDVTQRAAERLARAALMAAAGIDSGKMLQRAVDAIAADPGFRAMVDIVERAAHPNLDAPRLVCRCLKQDAEAALARAVKGAT